MSCCGSQRKQLRVENQARVSTDTNNAGNISLPSRTTGFSSVVFQYIGQTGLSVQGPNTGNYYRFSEPGAIVAVDQRDRPSLAVIASLRVYRK